MKKFLTPPRPSVLLAAVLSMGVLLPPADAARAADSPSPAPSPKGPMRQYESPYYIIYTDLEPNVVREVWARLTAMAEEYRDRTKSFGGTISSRRPFFLFSSEDDYRKAGGLAGSTGVYTGDKLMACANTKTQGQLWHVIQHEGFHQFAHKVISGRLPVWVNEGLAEYFGEGLWTGDGMVTGVIPASRLKRVREMIQDHKVLPFAEMMDMNNKEWNGALSSRNYDQAWSMVHFLVNGDGGKYCQAFNDFLNDVSRGGSPRICFQNRFGNDTKAFQDTYEKWWAGLEDRPTQDAYAQAAVSTLTSFLARATFLKMKFETADDFLAAVRDGKIQAPGDKAPQLWLPTSLGSNIADIAPKAGEWKLLTKPSLRLTLTRPDGTVYTGAFALQGDQRPQVKVAVEKPKMPASSPAPKKP